MKKRIGVLLLVFCVGIFTNSFAHGLKNKASKGEHIFLKNADECLSIIEQAANNKSIQGAVVIAYVPGEVTQSWISKMKIVGCYTNHNFNFLAVASSKVAEMATVLSADKDYDRKLLKGEWGYQGKVMQKVKSGYLLLAFSGGSAQQDTEVAQKGLDWLAEKFK